MPEQRKRETAYKLRIGDIFLGKPIVEDIPQETPDPNQIASFQVKERFRYLELGEKKIVRVNIIANIIEMYSSEGDKKYLSLTIDDASGQIRVKVFGDDVAMFSNLSHGDTIVVIGVLRSFNNELYILPEIIKKTDPRYLLVRKLELEKDLKKVLQGNKKEGKEIREQIIDIIKTGGDNGVSTEEIILKLTSASPEVINFEITRLLEDGMIYEPRPGKVRWLG